MKMYLPHLLLAISTETGKSQNFAERLLLVSTNSKFSMQLREWIRNQSDTPLKKRYCSKYVSKIDAL